MNDNRYISSNNSDGNYFVSMTDLMVGVLFIFIIMLMIFALNLGKKYDICAERLLRLENAHEKLIRESREVEENLVVCRKDLSKTKQDLEDTNREVRAVLSTRNQILDQLQSRISADGTKVQVDKENGVVSLRADLLFEKGNANLTVDGLKIMRRVADEMAEILPCYADAAPSSRQPDCSKGGIGRLDTVLIEGHTDSDKYAPGSAKNNWILSAERAISAFRVITEGNEVFSDIKNDLQQDLIGVSGYEARRPTDRLPGQTVEEKKSADRRIGFRLIMSVPKLREIDVRDWPDEE